MIDPFSLRYSDDNRKNTFHSGGNNGHWLKNVRCKQTLTKPIMSCVCVLRPVSVFCVLRMLGANTMLGAMDNMEFINVLSLNTIFVILQVR